ncbi:MAG: hypothetical protein K2K86_07340, partial [Muribaculaceae bacterium]|nr:hypothetical protein [Muribaculaceae bacterium]
VRYFVALGLIAALSAPVVDARDGRTGRGAGTTHQNNSPARPTGNPDSRPAGGHTNGNRPASGNRPGGNNRPGNNNRPSGNHNKPGNHMPGPGHNHPTPPPPQHGHNAMRPGHHTPPPPPCHSHWPAYHRPTPPPGYVYRGHGPSFGTILGIALGTAINQSLNYLYNNSYLVAGYGNNEIYLNNVMQMNFAWPDAVLYYNGGYLSSSRYIDYSTYNNTYRYNSLYNTFINQYGMPASVSNSGSSMSASWFGYDGRYVTISYSPGYTANGAYCYYTTLTFGN